MARGKSRNEQKRRKGPNGRPAEATAVDAYPHLATIKRSIHAIYQHFSAFRVGLYNESIQLTHLLGDFHDNSTLAVQRLAKAIAFFLNLHVGPIIVTFRDDLPVPGRVEITRENHFFVDISSAYRDHPRVIAAILAHEVMHIFLHRAGIEFSGLDDEILTDTAAAYLGIGWLSLDCYTIITGSTRTTEQRLGYLTPAECGYVLGKRALAFQESPETWFTGMAARGAYECGRAVALQDFHIPPLTDAPGQLRRDYLQCRRQAQEGRDGNRHHDYLAYGFEKDGALRVWFQCPVCFQRLRIPVGPERLAVHCPVCEGKFDCLP